MQPLTFGAGVWERAEHARCAPGVEGEAGAGPLMILMIYSLDELGGAPGLPRDFEPAAGPTQLPKISPRWQNPPGGARSSPGGCFSASFCTGKKEENVKIKTCKGGKSDPQGLGTPRSTPGSSWASWGRGHIKQHPRTPFPPLLAVFPLFCWCRVEKGNPKCDALVCWGAQDGCSHRGAPIEMFTLGYPLWGAHIRMLILGCSL